MEFMNRFVNLVVYANADRAQLKRIRPEISESNRKSVQVFSMVAALFFVVMIGLSFVREALSSNRSLYVVSAIATAVVSFLAAGPAKGNEMLTLVLTYLLMAAVLLFGIVLGTVTVPNEITATYIALLLMAPQLFTDRPVRLYGLIFSSVVLFIFMVLTHKSAETWNSDIVNAIVFGLLSAVCCTYTMMIKIERFCLVEQVRYLAETDQLTGVKNRNCYEMRLQNAAILSSASIYCVYVDVNGLHELNNTEGHAAGDRMLRYVATVMQNIFGANDTYRLGGDEFLAMGVDRDASHVEEMVSRMRMAVEAAGYHVAVGVNYRTKEELELDNLVKEAETRMYQDKSNYYRQAGRDRRKR